MIKLRISSLDKEEKNHFITHVSKLYEIMDIQEFKNHDKKPIIRLVLARKKT